MVPLSFGTLKRKNPSVVVQHSIKALESPTALLLPKRMNINSTVLEGKLTIQSENRKKNKIYFFSLLVELFDSGNWT